MDAGGYIMYGELHMHWGVVHMPYSAVAHVCKAGGAHLASRRCCSAGFSACGATVSQKSAG